MRKVGAEPTIQQEADEAQAAETPADEPTNIAASIPIEEGANTFAIDRDDMRRSLGNDKRGYVWPLNVTEPRIYMGVTSALNSIPKPALVGWASKVTAEMAVNEIDALNKLIEADKVGAINWLKGARWSTLNKAGNIGTAVHTIAELDHLGEVIAADAIWATLDPIGKNKSKQVRDFFDKVPMNVTVSEGVIYSDTHGYAGTLDFIIEFTDPEIIKLFPIAADENGKVTLLVDLKTSKGVYPETALQLAAYRHAEYLFDMRSGERLPMPETDGAAVLHVTESAWSLIPVDGGDEAFATFLSALDLSKYVPLDRAMVGIPSLKGKAAAPKPIPTPKPQTGTPTDLRGL